MEKIKCGEIFRTENTGQLYFFCYHCGDEYQSFGDIKLHIETHFNGLNNGTLIDTLSIKTDFDPTPTTEPIISLSDLKDEYEIKDENYYYDENEIVNKKTNINRNRIKKKSTKKYSCDICDNNRFYASRTHIYHHMKGCHGPKRQALAIYCQHCNMKFFSKKLLHQHQKLSNRFQPIDFRCQFCGHISAYECEYKLHFRVHINVDTLKCLICDNGKQFSSRKCLYSHMKRQHIEPKIKCNICDKEFRLRGNLDKHIRTHTGEKPYQCFDCKKYFPSKYNLIIHTRIHMQEKPYQCSMCGKQFYTNSQVNQHVKAAHIKFVAPLKCSRCYKTFITVERLKVHELQHDQRYDCTVCGNSFKSKKSLNSHSFIHKAKRYKCRYCEMLFVRATGRRDHEKHRHSVVV